MADLLQHIPIVETEISDEVLNSMIEEATKKLMADIKSSGIATISPRTDAETGRYSHTLLVIEDTVGGQINASFIQQGIYKTGEPDKPQWHMHDVTYWIDKGDTGVTNMHLHTETLPTGSRTIFDVFNNQEKLKLDNETNRSHLQRLLSDVLNATPNLTKTQEMKEIFKPYGVEVVDAKDLVNL